MINSFILKPFFWIIIFSALLVHAELPEAPKKPFSPGNPKLRDYDIDVGAGDPPETLDWIRFGRSKPEEIAAIFGPLECAYVSHFQNADRVEAIWKVKNPWQEWKTVKMRFVGQNMSKLHLEYIVFSENAFSDETNSQTSEKTFVRTPQEMFKYRFHFKNLNLTTTSEKLSNLDSASAPSLRFVDSPDGVDRVFILIKPEDVTADKDGRHFSYDSSIFSKRPIKFFGFNSN